MYDLVNIIIFLPLVVGFVLLFLPNRIKFVSQVSTVIISVLTFALGIRIFTIDRYYDCCMLRRWESSY